jgi:hypothetical protein
MDLDHVLVEFFLDFPTVAQIVSVINRAVLEGEEVRSLSDAAQTGWRWRIAAPRPGMNSLDA